jgi:hypothetical protein
MKVAAFAEIFILARIIAGALMLCNLFITPHLLCPFHSHVIPLVRFHEAIIKVTAKIDHNVNTPEMSPVVKHQTFVGPHAPLFSSGQSLCNLNEHCVSVMYWFVVHLCTVSCRFVALS